MFLTSSNTFATASHNILQVVNEYSSIFYILISGRIDNSWNTGWELIIIQDLHKTCKLTLEYRNGRIIHPLSAS